MLLLIDEKARLWSSSYKKDSQRRHLEKQDEDLSNLISAEMITKFEQSESTRRVIRGVARIFPEVRTIFQIYPNIPVLSHRFCIPWLHLLFLTVW